MMEGDNRKRTPEEMGKIDFQSMVRPETLFEKIMRQIFIACTAVGLTWAALWLYKTVSAVPLQPTAEEWETRLDDTAEHSPTYKNYLDNRKLFMAVSERFVSLVTDAAANGKLTEEEKKKLSDLGHRASAVINAYHGHGIEMAIKDEEDKRDKASRTTRTFDFSTKEKLELLLGDFERGIKDGFKKAPPKVVRYYTQFKEAGGSAIEQTFNEVWSEMEVEIARLEGHRQRAEASVALAPRFAARVQRSSGREL